MNIRNRLILLVALPLVFLLIFTWMTLSQSMKMRADAESVRFGIEKTVVISDLIHSLQAERGYSAGYIASNTGKFGTQMMTARSNTDAAIQRYVEISEAVEKAVPHYAEGVQGRLNELTEIRSQVSSLNIDVPSMAGFYTAKVEDLLSISMALVGGGEQIIRDKSNVYLELMLAKEAAGLERAIGTGAFSSGVFSPDTLKHFISLEANQNAHFHDALILAPQNRVNAIKSLKDGEQGIEVNQMRIDAKLIAFGKVPSVTADQWFNATTQRINAMKAVEDQLAADLAVSTAKIGDRLTMVVIVSAVLSLFALVATIFVAYLQYQKIAPPISRLADAIKKIGDGDYSVEVTDQNRKDEIGQFSGTLVEVRDNLAAAEETRTKAEAERKRLAQEQETVVDALTINLKKLSEGDLTAQIDQEFAPDYEQLKADFNGAVSQLNSLIRTVTDNAGNIRSNSQEITQAADDLSQRTENQAATLEETAAALDELTASVKSAAEGADKASNVVGEAKHNAESSGEVVQNAVSAMSEIEKSSTQISQIIGVIDDIAFQTNLLALNAGVEAARAGEAGRGFAVVASEVRALAQRSSDAAKEIKTLISASSQQVDKGVDLVGQAGSALKEIVSSVADINNLVSEIAGSAKEQSIGISEINTAVNQMDQGTQQNAAMVEETTAASHSLKQEAEELVRVVSRFKTDEGEKYGEHEAHEVDVKHSTAVAEAPSAPVSSGQDVAQQQARAAAFMANGSAAVDMQAAADDDWQDF